MRFPRLTLGVLLLAAAVGVAGEPQGLRQSARGIPSAEQADVLVVGGTTGGVAAAAQAARSGARVVLITQYPYLGEEVCATLRLWGEPDGQSDSPLTRRLFDSSPARPMHVKRVLDQWLLDAGVRFFFGCYPTDLLRDAPGNLAGVVMANRAGRQAVVAKVVVDATERATVARLAGAGFAPYPAGRAEFRRVVVGGEPAVGTGVDVRRLPLDWFGKAQPNPAYECVLTLPMEDGSYASFARAEQRARDLTFHPQQLDAAERLFQIPPDAMEGQAACEGPWPGAERIDLDVFRPRGIARLYVLGGCAAVSRQAAGQLLRPGALIDLGVRIGQEAAQEARHVPQPQSPQVDHAPATGGLLPEEYVRPASESPQVARTQGEEADVVPGEVREPLSGLRPVQPGASTILSPERQLPIAARYDVVVVGGGTSGAAAAIAAARQGARTLVLDCQHSLGGVGTLGLIGKYWNGVREGFTAEVDQGVAQLGARVGVLGKAEWWRQATRRAGADIWFGVLGCGAVVDGSHVRGVVVATPQGRCAVLAHVVIDATGNADIAAAAGAPCAYVDASDLSMQLAGLPARQLGDSYVNTCYLYTDETDVVDQSSLLVVAKDRFREAYDLGTLVDTRERRRVGGEFVLQPTDLHAGRTYPDTISVHASNYDMYGFPVHPLYLLAIPPKKQVIRGYLPYRCLLPQGLDGLLVVGLGLSAGSDAMAVIRMQPDLQNLGYAAGLAAAEAARSERPLRELDVRSLQRQLVEIGNLPAEVLDDSDSFPVARERLESALQRQPWSPEDLALVVAHRDAALPLLRAALAAADSDADRLGCARVLAVLGDGAGVETLLAALDRAAWDEGQDIVTSGESGANYSPLDMLILALGRAGDRRAAAPICAKAKQLEPQSGLSHFRAVAVALETLADPSAAATLADLLQQPGMTGHAITTLADARRKRGEEEQRQGRTVRLINPALRELILARALYRCGDQHGLGERILRQYEQDLQGPLARHAHAVLESRR